MNKRFNRHQRHFKIRGEGVRSPAFAAINLFVVFLTLNALFFYVHYIIKQTEGIEKNKNSIHSIASKNISLLTIVKAF